MNFQLILEVNNGMNWLPIIILFITWAYTLYKWMKSERDLNKFIEITKHYWMRNIELENQLIKCRKDEDVEIQEAWMKTLNADKHDTYKEYAVNPRRWLGK